MTGENLSQANADKKRLERIRSVSISLASPNEIRSWSHGEVTKPDAFNARIRSASGCFRPQQLAAGGLLCQKIFGPVISYRCACGKYQGGKEARGDEGKTCERCGVLVADRSVRRHRMGHIELAAPVVHPFYFRGSPSFLTDLFKVVLEIHDDAKSGRVPINSSLIEKIIYRERSFIVKEDEQDEIELTGAEGIKSLLTLLNGIDVGSMLRKAIKGAKSGQKKQTLSCLLELFDSAARGTRVVSPELMVLGVIAVVPPVSRQVTVLKDQDANGLERVEVGDLNRLYGRVIRTNNALKELLEIRAPAELIRRRKRHLQRAVNALFENESLPRPVKARGGRPLGSLLGLIKGKSGRFRRSLLGKRVDFSGRAVIVVNPKLRLGQCGLPERIAEVLYRPFVLRRLESLGLVAPDPSLGMENKNFREQLAMVMREHPVLLNRAPTLHRMGIQAFYPVLSESNAIELHPLVCRAFTADFDGDTMSVHLPLSSEAQVEASTLLSSHNNLLSPANGRVMFTPSQDIVMGLYYLTLVSDPPKSLKGIFASCDELELARDSQKLDIHDAIEIRLPMGRKVISALGDDGEGSQNSRRIKTTVGRALFNGRLPSGLPYYNCALNAKTLATVLNDCLEQLGRKETLDLAEELAHVGFAEATRSGLSLGIEDLIVPDEKGAIVENAHQQIELQYQHQREGKLSSALRKAQLIETWNAATGEVAQALMEALKGEARPSGSINPVLVMAESGARGSETQLKQLSGMRGLMSKANGEVAEHPITSNFREGLSLGEYFISTHGTRKSFCDIGLKTAEGGYLMRRLVHAAGQVVVTTQDCGTQQGVDKRPRNQASLGAIVCGRVSLVEVRRNAEVLVKRNSMITPLAARQIDASGREMLRVRSPLTCEAPVGVCQLCYGMDLSTQKLVELGTAVGVVAAQSIGEPGTQLTMLTKHSGGIAGEDITGGLPRVEELLEARCPQVRRLFQSGGAKEVMDYLLKELQAPYSSQGVEIDEKHFEIVIGEMLGKTRVDCSGDTQIIPGSLIRKRELARQNAALPKGARKAQGEEQLLGITAIALSGESFLAAASFREPKQVLRSVGLGGGEDELTGITENVIVGGLIPVGTGFPATEVINEELPAKQLNLSKLVNEMKESTSQTPSKGKLSVLLVDSPNTMNAEQKDHEQELELLLAKLDGGEEDQEIWNRIIELIWDRLVRKISRTTGIDEGIARRLTSNILHGIVKSRKRFPSLRAFWKYVWSSCENKIRNYLERDLKRRRRERVNLRDLMEVDRDLTGREREVEAAGEKLAKMKTEAKLTDYQRKVFDLAWEKSLSDRAIAQQLEKSEGAIRSIKSKIRDKLRLTATALKLREVSLNGDIQ